MNFARYITALMLSFSACLSAEEIPPEKPYDVTVWADVVYDATGNPVQITFPDKAKYPEKFIQHLQMKLAVRRIEPRRDNGVPATFETGVTIGLTVSPSATGAEVKINEIREAPRTVSMTMAKFPADLLRSGWTGVIRTKCTVGLEGRCVKTEVLNAAGMPKSAIKFGLVSMNGWRFIPQKVNGKVVEYEFIVPYTLTSTSHRRVFSSPRFPSQ